MRPAMITQPNAIHLSSRRSPLDLVGVLVAVAVELLGVKNSLLSSPPGVAEAPCDTSSLSEVSLCATLRYDDEEADIFVIYQCYFEINLSREGNN